MFKRQFRDKYIYEEYYLMNKNTGTIDCSIVKTEYSLPNVLFLSFLFGCIVFGLLSNFHLYISITGGILGLLFGLYITTESIKKE